MKRSLLPATLVLGLVAADAPRAHAGIVSSYGATYSTPKVVIYNPAAPNSNFAAPTNGNETVGYNVYFTADANYVYGAVEATPSQGGTDPSASNLVFANIYLSTNLSQGSNIGFEVTNDRAFIPGGSGYQENISELDYNIFTSANTGGTAIEFRIAWSFFTDDPRNMGFTKVTPGGPLQLRLSQSFGYSVAGGAASYGDDRLGQVTYQPTVATVPEPSTLGGAVMAIGLGFIYLRGRARRPATSRDS